MKKMMLAKTRGGGERADDHVTRPGFVVELGLQSIHRRDCTYICPSHGPDDCILTSESDVRTGCDMPVVSISALTQLLRPLSSFVPSFPTRLPRGPWDDK